MIYDRGLCDLSTGTCHCRNNFHGPACQYMSCPGLDPVSGRYCHGHGKCLNMADLAQKGQLNGVTQDYTYGSDVNDPHYWDSERIFGCFCDSGYLGYDCSLRDCVHGDDPGTYLDHSEIQLYQCTANEGNFTLSFRDQTTSLLSHNISAIQLQQALTRLKNIPHISVYYLLNNNVPNNTLFDLISIPDKPNALPSWARFKYNYNTSSMTIVPKNISLPATLYNTSFCDAQGDQVAILVFTHTHGDVPALSYNTSYLINTLATQIGPGSGTITSYADGESLKGLLSVRGSTETDVCNHRGLCDYETGQCACFRDWTSSDGSRQGGPGYTGDCGTRNEMLYSSFNSFRTISLPK
jgi:hypothetical protein